MSLFSKITILFLISASIMGYISYKTDKISNQNSENEIKQRYIQSSNELLDAIVNNDKSLLDELVASNDFEILPPDKKEVEKEVILSTKISFGEIKIFKNDANNYLLSIVYLDEETLFFDTMQLEQITQKRVLDMLILTDIFILVLMFLIIYKMLLPLRKLPLEIEKFAQGNYDHRITPDNSSSEISKVVSQFNKMAQNIESLLNSRRQFLRDISHELRTPISKSKISLEMIEPSRYKDILKRSIDEIDILTNEILELEKLSSNTNIELDIETFSVETLLARALDKILIDDTETIDIDIKKKFLIEGDLNYLSIALKNLIENAHKYKTRGKIIIVTDEKKILVKNFAPPLLKPFEYYTEIFTQEDSSRNKEGYGLGLNIVTRILEHHGFHLRYDYEKDKVVFIMDFDR